jgi:cytidylate kinase
MAIITISRELAALGDETARELAKMPGYRLVDKTALEEKIKSCGMGDRDFKKYDEKKPSLLASLSRDRDHYLHYLKFAIYSEAECGNCVIIGRGAGAVFKDMPAHVSVFLAASIDIRIERVKSYFHCDRRRALQIIERSDQDRLGFHRYFFDIEWQDPGNYHLSLNTGFLLPSTCAEIVNNLKEQIFTPEAEAQNAARLKELILGQKIRHSIIHEQNIPIHFLEITVSGGNVTLYGVANTQAAVDSALAAAVREAPPPAAVQNEIQIVQEYSVMP